MLVNPVVVSSSVKRLDIRSYNVKQKISPGGSVDTGLFIAVDLLCISTEMMSLQYSKILFSSYPQHDTLKGEVPSTVLMHELEEKLHIVDSSIVSRLWLMQKKIG